MAHRDLPRNFISKSRLCTEVAGRRFDESVGVATDGWRQNTLVYWLAMEVIYGESEPPL
jgi:hypothetical protein